MEVIVCNGKVMIRLPNCSTTMGWLVFPMRPFRCEKCGRWWFGYTIYEPNFRAYLCSTRCVRRGWRDYYDAIFGKGVRYGIREIFDKEEN